MKCARHRPSFFRLLPIWMLIWWNPIESLVWGFSSTNSPIQYHKRTWQKEDGLPQDLILSMAQTRDGYLWIGTVKGLARFDGVGFKLFDSHNTPALKNSSINALLPRADGSLWIGTGGGGITLMKDGNFIPDESSTELRNANVKTIFEGHDGSLWVGALEGLFQKQNRHWKRYTRLDGLQVNVVRCLEESDDQLWIGTASGISMLQYGVITQQAISSDKAVRAILKDREGTLWIGMTGGLACLRPDGSSKIYTRDDGLADNIVSAIYQDRNGELWVGTYGGLNRFVNGKFTTEMDSLGAYYDQVNVITEDQEGDIWVGTRDGLHELREKRFTTYTRQDGLSHNNIVSVLEDKKGNIWLGTWGGGVSRLNEKGVVNFNGRNSMTNGLASDLILSLLEDTDGSLLIGADYEGGTFRMRGEKFKRFWSTKQAQIDRVIRVIYRDHLGNLWFGAASGLVLWKNNTNETFLREQTPRCILEDHQGTLWVGTSEGLSCRTNGEFLDWTAQQGRPRDAVLSLYEDTEGSLWIGTATRGLWRFKEGRLTACSTQQGLLSGDIFEILEDDRGWLWMSCSKGIFRVNKKSLDDLDAGKTSVINSIAYGKSDGMETVQCSGVAKPGAWKSRDGRLWFATTKGVVVTDPNMDLKSNDRPPPVMIEEVIADKKEFVIPGGIFQTNQPGLAELRVPPGRGDLELHYTGLSFQAPEKVCFKYKLENVDPDWIEVTRRVAYYNNLRPGNYRFRVKACNNDGVWSETEASVALVLAPHFWQTWWFISSVGILAVAAAGGTVRYTTRRNMERELRRLEKQHAIEEERIRIARDMHDEIGAKLTKISFLGAMARRKLLLPEEAGVQIENMSQTARDVIRALDEIVWAVNPANDTMEHLATYLCRNATEFFANSPVVCQFNIPDELPVCRLGTDVRHNILLSAKEAMNNILKHAGATIVLVKISVEPQQFEVVIADNGHGFEQDAAPADALAARSIRVGNGLRNMHERLDAIGGSCEVASSPGQGTRIIFTVRLKTE